MERQSAGAKRLTRRWLKDADALPSGVVRGVLTDFPEKVVQFGEGNFLRAFADWMFDELNEAGEFGGRVVVVQPIRHGMASLLNEQEGLYTLLLRGVQQGQVVRRLRIVTSISRAIDPYDCWEEVARCFHSPCLRFVVSNTTEAGIALVDEPYLPGECPESFPGKVAALLYERFRALHGDPGRGLVFLPCELIDGNGAMLRQIVLQHAERWKLGGAFADWVLGSNYFLNTLVDRIVPGYPRDEAAELTRQLGYDDALLVCGEVFHLWVIEGPQQLAAELPFHRVGLNVVWTGDLAPYRTRKVRILNGAHTAGSLAAFLGGLNTVREMMEDRVFGRFLEKAVFEEILPTVSLPDRDRRDYAQAVLERFRNPFLRHELLSIALNSVSKWKVRVLPTLLEYLQDRGELPSLLTFSLAALVHFYQGRRTAAGELQGRRGVECYPIRDQPDVLDVFAPCCDQCQDGHATRQGVVAILAYDRLWGMDLNTIAGFAEAVTAGLELIGKYGMRQAVEMLLS
ncbi:MAG: tagaturonate reductase [Thermoguttaceae bacterium]